MSKIISINNINEKTFNFKEDIDFINQVRGLNEYFYSHIDIILNTNTNDKKKYFAKIKNKILNIESLFKKLEPIQALMEKLPIILQKETLLKELEKQTIQDIDKETSNISLFNKGKLKDLNNKMEEYKSDIKETEAKIEAKFEQIKNALIIFNPDFKYNTDKYNLRINDIKNFMIMLRQEFKKALFDKETELNKNLNITTNSNLENILNKLYKIINNSDTKVKVLDKEILENLLYIIKLLSLEDLYLKDIEKYISQNNIKNINIINPDLKSLFYFENQY